MARLFMPWTNSSTAELAEAASAASSAAACNARRTNSLQPIAHHLCMAVIRLSCCGVDHHPLSVRWGTAHLSRMLLCSCGAISNRLCCSQKQQYLWQADIAGTVGRRLRKSCITVASVGTSHAPVSSNSCPAHKLTGLRLSSLFWLQ